MQPWLAQLCYPLLASLQPMDVLHMLPALPPPPSLQVLLGYYLLPSGMDDPVEVVLNPVGEELRSKPRVW
jgi:hypothetical protein